MSYQKYSLQSHIKELLDDQWNLSSKVDNMGFLHLISDYSDENSRNHEDIALDPAKGYRLCLMNTSYEHISDPIQSYSEHAALFSSNETKLPEGMEKEKIISTNNIYVEIKEFSPNINIDDSEFTVEQFNIPDDTPQYELLTQ